MKFTARWGPRLAVAAALSITGGACKPAHGDGPAAAGQEAKKEANKDGFGKLSVGEVQAAIAKGDVAIFDNNSKKQWEQGHVPTSKWVDYKHLEAKDLPEEKGRQLVFYCANEF